LNDAAAATVATILWRVDGFPLEDEWWENDDLLSVDDKEGRRERGGLGSFEEERGGRDIEGLLSLKDREGREDEDSEGRDEDERDLSL
jgi:hypothetical protein